jgi:hypothetical protein
MKGRKDVPWSVPISVNEVPESGRHLDLVADGQVRERIASLGGVGSVPRLEAAFDVMPHGHDGLQVTGRVWATVAQTCVVTLAPIENTVEEAIDVVFAPPAVAPEFGQNDGPPAVTVADDAPEPLVNGMVDLGVLATDYLLLGIDPYPRAPGATFEAPAAVADEGAHPFAALAALKKGPEK